MPKKHLFEKLSVMLVLALLLSMVYVGAVFATTGTQDWRSASATPAEVSVTNQDNAWAEDDAYAVFDTSGDSATYSFGASFVPVGAIIEGIEVRLDAYKDVASDFTYIVQLYRANTPVGNAVTNVVLPDSDTDTYITLGSPTDNWGYAGWLDYRVNTTNFRVCITANGTVNNAYLDHVQVKVYFTKLVPTVTTWPAATAITFGQSLASSTLNADGVASVAGSFAFTDPAIIPSAVGTYTASVTFTPANPTDYDIVTGTVDVTVDPKPITVTADAQGKVFGDADPALTYTSSDPAVIFTGGLARDAGEDVAAYAINQGTLSAGDNYTITYVGADLTITEKGVTVTADAQSKVFGDADPTLTYTSSDPAVVFSGALARDAGEAVAAYAINQGTLSAGDNYTITYVGADLTITEKGITVTADPQSKAFGDADPALTYTSSDPAVVFTGELARDAGEDVAAYAINQGTLSAGDNYTITYVGADLTITPASIAVTIDASSLSQTYNGMVKTITVTTDPAGLSYNVTFMQGGVEVSPIAKGSYDVIVTITDPNYSGTASATLIITDESIPVTGETGSGVLIGLILLLGAAVLIFIKRRRFGHKNMI